jgi:hypothetical protein
MQNLLTGLLGTANAAAAYGIVDTATDKTRIKYWQHGVDSLQELFSNPIDPYLRPDQVSMLDRIDLLKAFAARVRTGYYGRGCPGRTSTVTDALCSIGKTCELAGFPNPIWSSEDLLYALTRSRPWPRTQTSDSSQLKTSARQTKRQSLS